MDLRWTDDFDPLAAEDLTSAHALYRDLRGRCPVAHSNEWNGFWALLRYGDVVSALRQSDTFITSVQNVVPKVAFTGRRPPLHFDPPDHTPYRRALNPFFTAKKMQCLEPAVRAITIQLLNPLIEGGGGEVCSEFTRKLPGHVFAEFFHLSPDLAMSIKETTVIYNRALQEADDNLVKETSLRLYELARLIIEMRKSEPWDPTEDPTSALLQARGNDGELLPENLVLGTIRQMIVVGMIAPSVMIGCILVHLAQHPEIERQLREEPDLIPAAAEEYLRLFTPYRGFARTAKHDVEFGGRSIHKDEPIALVYASANRDEQVFENPDEFILNRPNIDKHIAFGLGPHRCAGAPLARMMLRVTLEELLRRAKVTGLAGEVIMTRWPEWGVLSASVLLETAMKTGRVWVAPYVATLLAMLALQMSNLGFSPLLPSIRDAFHMNFAQMGLFAGMYGLLSILWSVPAGMLAKRFGERTVLAGGLVTVAAGLAALSMAPGFAAAFGARAIWLSGYRFSFVSVMVAVALTCPPAVQGASMGILGAVSAFASVIGAPLGGTIGQDFGWRNGILSYAGVALAGSLVFAVLYCRAPDVLGVPQNRIHKASASAFRSPLVWSLAALSGLAGMGSLSANFFVPSAAQALFHLDQVEASYLISTGFTLAIFVNLLFGFLMDRYHRWKVMAALAGLGMLGGMAMTSHRLMVFRVGTAVVLALGHAGIQQSYTLAADVLRGRETGNVMGVVSMVAGVFSYLGPQMLGLLRDWSGNFEAGWYFIIGAAAATLLLVAALWSYASRQTRTSVAVLLGLLVAAGIPAFPQSPPRWIEPGKGGTLPAEFEFSDDRGRLGIVDASGSVSTQGHPFFKPLGANGRACVTCHQPAYAMSLSAAAARERWNATQGKDPLFAAIDGSNCPDLPQEKESSHSLLLNRGLIRLAIPWPPAKAKPEFTIDVVSDPTGCNTSAVYGLHSAHPAVSVFRRPRMAANLKYVTNPTPKFALKLGGLADVDPETGQPVSMNFMADAREPSLRSQARTAAREHEERQAPLSDAVLQRIVDFESQIYSAQVFDEKAGNLAEAGGPPALGPWAMAKHRTGVLGDNDYDPVFQLFNGWKQPGQSTPQAEFRASVARGNDIFLFRQFWLRDATHINSIGLGNPLKRTCATCHNAQMTGQDLSAGWVDVGTTNYPTWTEPLYSESRELPVFKITCDKDAPPHPYLGRVIYTSDPGRALISGRCVDVGSIVMQQFRGLAARAPYFSNGSAKSLRELVDFYDRRFDMKLSDQEKQDLINFLGVL